MVLTSITRDSNLHLCNLYLKQGKTLSIQPIVRLIVSNMSNNDEGALIRTQKLLINY